MRVLRAWWRRRRCHHRSQRLHGQTWTCDNCGGTSEGRSLVATLNSSSGGVVTSSAQWLAGGF